MGEGLSFARFIKNNNINFSQVTRRAKKTTFFTAMQKSSLLLKLFHHNESENLLKKVEKRKKFLPSVFFRKKSTQAYFCKKSQLMSISPKKVNLGEEKQSALLKFETFQEIKVQVVDLYKFSLQKKSIFEKKKKLN